MVYTNGGVPVAAHAVAVARSHMIATWHSCATGCPSSASVHTSEPVGNEVAEQEVELQLGMADSNCTPAGIKTAWVSHLDEQSFDAPPVTHVEQLLEKSVL